MEVGLDSPIGTEIAGYRIEALLGRGGMSVVYRAEDLALGRKVALKLMSPELSENEDFRDRFRMEWRRAASIDHPNVIPIYEAGDHDGQLFIAMRYVEGTDLKALLEEEGALEPTRALNLLSQAAEGLDAAHNRGLVHRDVKPSNVLISREGDKEHAYLADFGLTKPASTAEEARESIQLSGTTDYVSPEQVADGTADARSDIYGLGALLYESMTGEVPYPRERKLQVLFAHVNDPPPKPTEVNPGLPEAIDAVIAKAMAKEPEDRYASGAELGDAAATAFPVPRRPRWQLAALVGVLALLIAAAIAIPAILLTGGSGEAEPLGKTEVTTTSVQRIDAETGQLVATIELESSPDRIEFGEDAIWLLHTGNRSLTRIDPASGLVAEEIALEQLGASPVEIAVGEGAVWISLDAFHPSSPDETLWAFVPDTGMLAATTVKGVGSGLGLAIGEDAVWAMDWTGRTGESPVPYVVYRVRPSDREQVATIPLAVGELSMEPADAIAVGEGEVWIAGGSPELTSGATGSTPGLWKIEAASEIPTVHADLPAAADDVAYGEGSVWIAHGSDHGLSRIDSESGRVVEIDVGRSSEAVTVGGGSIWTANSRDGTVTRLDPNTLDIETIRVGGIPEDITFGAGSVWVTVRPG